MAWYSFVRDERLVGLGLMAAATVGMYVGVRVALQPYHASSVVYPAMPKTQYITQDTEDSLSADTLNSLLDHYNFSIRETAAKIVCDRAINDDATLRRLLWGMGRPAYDERMMSLRALSMLTDQTTMHRLNSKEAFAAFVRCLEQCMAANVREGVGVDGIGSDEGSTLIDDIYFDDYYLRDYSEKLCLMFLAQLTDKYDIDLLVRVGFVERWLAKQRWGPPAARADNWASFVRHRDNRIADICRRLRDTLLGRSALRKAGLLEVVPPSARQGARSHSHKQLDLLQLPLSPLDAPLRLELRTSPLQVRAISATGVEVEAADVVTELARGTGGEVPAPVLTNVRTVLSALDGLADGDGDGAAEAVDGVDGVDGDDVEGDAQSAAGGPRTSAPTRPRQPRPPIQSSREEQRIRRQHREAMVLNDGTRPLRRDDIFERESD
ncbi:hypothetical protein HMPREF1624_05387 [Sporothrix schenckii ATCC 58251]|uniref:Cytoskeleton-associated protein n=1 Tax=Sporothrix schenckii (strain ATCC 58251 / de Perez 2211183) TaxID=1391915 RepID=U7PVV9_SPOS1|nr:hypothetical protein HMPREF1624_05387 [Sporothrix schenckii ATCC 58251]